MDDLKHKKKKFEHEKRLNKLAKAGPHSFAVVLDHLKAGFNIGKIFRSANAFGAAEVFVVGTDFFDPYPAKGASKQTPAIFLKDFSETYPSLQEKGYTVYALAVEGAKNLSEVVFAEKSAFVVGHEEFGLSFSPADYPHLQMIKIPQFGHVQSLNASIAATLVMYEFLRQQNKL